MRRAVVVGCLAGMLIGAGVLAFAQNIMPEPVPAVVLSGAEIGFRMVARKGDKAVGHLVVRVDGRWVEAEQSGGVKPVGIK
jgi:hypothetical protein